MARATGAFAADEGFPAPEEDELDDEINPAMCAEIHPRPLPL